MYLEAAYLLIVMKNRDFCLNSFLSQLHKCACFFFTLLLECNFPLNEPSYPPVWHIFVEAVTLLGSYTSRQLHVQAVTRSGSYTSRQLHVQAVKRPGSYTFRQLHVQVVTRPGSYTSRQFHVQAPIGVLVVYRIYGLN